MSAIEPESPAQDDKRSMGSRPLGRLMPAITRRITPRRGLARGALLSHWRDIVGPELAAMTAPVRIAQARPALRSRHDRPGRGDSGGQGAVLHVQVAPALALELQHQTEQLLERVNAHLGFRAIGRIKLIQEDPRLSLPLAGKQGRRRPAAPLRPLTPAEESRLSAQLDGIADSGLRAALERLGSAVKAESPAG